MKRKPEIKSVIFDLGNVLLNYDAEKAAKQFAAACGVPVKKLWGHFFTSSVEKAYTRGEISCREFYAHARKVFKIPVTYAAFRNYWNDIFWENEGMQPLLAKLKKHYPLYLISNTNRMHFEHIKKKFKVLKHFKKTFPSHEVGARKPEREIYKRVLSKIRLKPEETVFIDDMPDFVAGARKAGMYAIQFKGKEKLIRDLKKMGIKI